MRCHSSQQTTSNISFLSRTPQDITYLIPRTGSDKDGTTRKISREKQVSKLQVIESRRTSLYELKFWDLFQYHRRPLGEAVVTDDWNTSLWVQETEAELGVGRIHQAIGIG